MPKLLNQTRNNLIAERVDKANYIGRLIGLIGKESLESEQTLWISRCNSIHTFFMKFPIDVVFVDRKLKVKLVKTDIKPWRLVLPVWGADSVFEFSGGSLSSKQIETGDQLHVGD